ncbi:ATP-binding cassette domain-containing protein [Ancylomarina sp. 16SWW S1-10-2]|uniref:ATP-binding cassette domain-containing protein n=1 Tax=Ancylomarina sp. 16SWW S1-10-2 TaxID=2499681 RepID=UPI0012AE9CC8|nr:ATP-binding cassette domain-containing protein [Ancylomarina sp. 16SWW S1-10-2]MRT93349.1 ATP-binding cassette domain-containing protein [Ancylomarina sp. 16SWW S1-10-2]
MSERILKALMQLFAIIAHPEGTGEKRRRMVVKYLYRLLDQDSAQEYLNLYDKYYQDTVERNNKRSKRNQVTSSRSVRVLRICSEMNKELVERQKVIIVIQLLEFLRESNEITEEEKEFVATVADTFNLPTEGYTRLQDFMLSDFDDIIESKRLLTINNKKSKTKGEHIYSEGISGEIKILRLARIDLFVIRFQGLTELFMNGLALKQDHVHILTQGSSIRNPKIAPIYFSDIQSTFNRDTNIDRVVFETKNIEFRYKGNDQGVHNNSFKEESGKMVGIMGSSGAGKTTLLNILNGSLAPQKGQVLINGLDIYKQKDLIEGIIGHVSQDDLLIGSLTVFENLYFNAKLCFDKKSPFQIIRLVYKVLNDLGLFEAKNLQVGSPLDKKISGGQRKRLNIALELIREPAVLFLDEPTSGLSSRDSSKIMDLLKNLARKGKLIFVVVHQPSSETFKMFDRLLFLDLGGYMIFNGNPIDAITYFKSQTHQANRSSGECEVCGNIDADQIFNMVESEVLDEYGLPTQVRKVSPQQWDERLRNASDIPHRNIKKAKELPPISFKIPNQFKQFKVFVNRDILSKLANPQYLLINLFETPLLAFILSYIIKFYNIDKGNKLGYTFSSNSNIPVYLFMSVIIALFIGLTLSAEEIIKDRIILKRERFLNLSKNSYLLSKVVILFTVSAFQAFVFVLIGNYILEIKDMYFTYWIVLFSSWCFANMLGLVISDSFKTVINIYILIPFILIPQLILSGIIVKFDKINPNISHPNRVPWYGEIITARWAYEALAVYQFTTNKYESNFYLYDKVMSQADYKKNYWLPILKNKLEDCKKKLNQGKVDEIYKLNLELIYNELKSTSLPLSFQKLELLKRNPTNIDLLDELKLYIDDLNNHYIMLYNAANKEKDEKILELQSQFPDKDSFVKMKKSYDNNRLTEFVTNNDDIERIVEYQNRLFQKIDPIFKDGESSFLKAHFYAPRKKIFDREYDTYWVNIIVIWTMTISLYIILYFGLFKRMLNSLEKRLNKLM